MSTKTGEGQVGKGGWREIHPYFGFTLNTHRTDVNRAGFRSEFEYPYKRKKDEFTIGIFGGSVADALTNTRTAVENLKRSLQSEIRELHGKKIVILNMAYGAQKQPQAYLIESFYAGMFDMTVNLDGWNDSTYHANYRKFPVYYPEYSKFYFSSDVSGLLMLRLAIFLRQSLQAEVSLLKIHSNLYSARCVILLAGSLAHIMDGISQWIYIRWEPNQLVELQNSFDEFSQEAVEVWQQSIYKQRIISAAWNARSYFFIQPNQYVPDTKEFSKEELEVAFDKNEDVPHIAGQFKKLEQARQSLVRDKVKIFSLIDVFKKTKETIYIDSCCHVNDRGNEILAEEIAKKIVQNW